MVPHAPGASLVTASRLLAHRAAAPYADHLKSPSYLFHCCAQAATKQFGSTILLSEDFVSMLSPGVRCACCCCWLLRLLPLLPPPAAAATAVCILPSLQPPQACRRCCHLVSARCRLCLTPSPFSSPQGHGAPGGLRHGQGLQEASR